MANLEGKLPIVYQDGVRIIAVDSGGGYPDVHYGISKRMDSADIQLVLSQNEARELRDALTWIISEVDMKCGHESFKPKLDGRLASRSLRQQEAK